jgi:TRAP-type C4-dicarboxylate transport system permease small subunit
MQPLSRLQEHLLNAMMGLCGLLVLAMMLIITGDVVLRNLGLRGIAWSNEVSEDILYLVTLMSGPWLLRQGRHIRVDILLRALPPRRAWQLEWVGDLLGLACCLYFVWYGTKATLASYLTAAVSIRTLVMPEWWLLAPLPVTFLLFAIEFAFRIHRLGYGERTARSEAVSAS